MLRLARLNAWLMMLILLAQSAARTNDHCSCHSVKSKTFTRLMFERGFRAAAAHRARDLKLSPPSPRDLMKPVLEELWRSLRAERRQITTAEGAARELARAVNETGDWVLVYIANWLRTTLEAYHQHLGLGLVLNDVSTASKFFRAHLPCDRMIEVMREGHPRARPMDADDPFHPCRRGGPLANESWWSADHAAASEQLRQAEAGEAPLGGTARKHLGLG